MEVLEKYHQISSQLKVKVRINFNKKKLNSIIFLAGESEQIAVPIDMQTIGNNNDRKSSQLTNLNLFKKPNLTPKIWMDFDDFCTCFTSIIIFHNPHGYQYAHKHTEIKVK